MGSYNEEHRTKPTVAGKCNDAVEKLARHLVASGY